jgi:DNA repair protein RadC
MASNGPQEGSNCVAYLTSLVQVVAGDVPYNLCERLIEEFGSLAGVLAADEYALNRIAAPFPHVIAFLILLKNATLHALAFEVRQAPIIATGHALRDYLFARLSHATAEQFRVLFLDMQHMLIRDELMGIGSVSQTSAYPREIIKRALELGATKLILVHNHPSGDSTASPADVKLTRDIANACRHLELSLVDHIIIARSNWSSLRAAGLL